MSEAGRQQDLALDAMLAGNDVVVWTRSRARSRVMLEALAERAEARGLPFTPSLGTAELRAARGRGRILALVRGQDHGDGLKPTVAYNDEWTRLP